MVGGQRKPRSEERGFFCVNLLRCGWWSNPTQSHRTRLNGAATVVWTTRHVAEVFNQLALVNEKKKVELESSFRREIEVRASHPSKTAKGGAAALVILFIKRDERWASPLDASGAHWKWNGGSSDVEWRNYIRSVEGTDQILFYTSPVCFNILPKRAIGPQQLAEVRGVLQQNIQGKK